jgi:hypothetical protein
MQNPRMHMRKYAERWLRVHDYDPDLFARHVQHIDPDAKVDQALRILEEVAQAKRLGEKPAVQMVIEIEDIGQPPPVFCRQIESEEAPDDPQRREHPGGHPGVGFENGEPVPVIEFDYSSVCTDVEPGQRKELIGALEMLNWLDEPVENDQVCISTPRTREIKHKLLRLIIAPASLGNPTLGQLATMCCCSKSFVGKLVSDFRDRYRIVTPWMKSDAAREAYRLAHLHETKEAA